MRQFDILTALTVDVLSLLVCMCVYIDTVATAPVAFIIDY